MHLGKIPCHHFTHLYMLLSSVLSVPEYHTAHMWETPILCTIHELFQQSTLCSLCCHLRIRIPHRSHSTKRRLAFSCFADYPRRKKRVELLVSIQSKLCRNKNKLRNPFSTFHQFDECFHRCRCSTKLK